MEFFIGGIVGASFMNYFNNQNKKLRNEIFRYKDHKMVYDPNVIAKYINNSVLTIQDYNYLIESKSFDGIICSIESGIATNYLWLGPNMNKIPEHHFRKIIRLMPCKYCWSICPFEDTISGTKKEILKEKCKMFD